MIVIKTKQKAKVEEAQKRHRMHGERKMPVFKLKFVHWKTKEYIYMKRGNAQKDICGVIFCTTLCGEIIAIGLKNENVPKHGYTVFLTES